MMKEAVYEGSRPVSGSRMNHHAGRLVDDDQIVILKHDIERQVLRLGFCRLCRGNCQGDAFSGFDPVIRLIYLVAAEPGVTLFDQGFDA